MEAVTALRRGVTAVVQGLAAGKAAQAAAYGARLTALRVALHIAARQAVSHGAARGAAQPLGFVVDGLAGMWEELKAAEEAAALEEAAEFRTKEQSLHVANEEVGRWC